MSQDNQIFPEVEREAQPVQTAHQSVLLQESIDALDLHSGDMVVDGTLGRAGHTIALLTQVPNLTVIGIDRDEDALEESRTLCEQAGFREGQNFHFVFGNFSDMEHIVKNITQAPVQGVLLDIGVSSPHFDSSGRGFSFQKDEPLLMTMTKNGGPEQFTARDIVMNWEEEDIANVIYAYGEERYARRIARKIVEIREHTEINTTFDLVAIIESAVPSSSLFFKGKKKAIHPATKTFQALRIAVNNELGSLQKGLDEAYAVLAPKGRMAIITFHSLEDRIVKNWMKDKVAGGNGTTLTKKPITPTEEEQQENRRSRSAKLRVFIKA